jgi:predicted acetyltransferase
VDDVRLLTGDDMTAAWLLSRATFGGDRTPPPAWLAEWQSQRAWGVFDAGRLVAHAVDREQQQWFGGRLVPTCGVASMVVVPEMRGMGLARKALTALLAAARDRGAVISTLFNTIAAPYRRLGWEEVGTLTWLTLPTLALAGVRRPELVELRSAVAADVPGLRSVYRAVAQVGTGWVERSGPLFPATPEAVLAAHDGITVAFGPGGVVEGYAAWDRGRDPDGVGHLTVPDLVGGTERATTALLAMLGRWASVAPTLRLRLPDRDPALLLAETTKSRVASRHPWMLRVVDVCGAIAARGWPPHLSGDVDLALEDDICPWNTGKYRLVIADGTARLEPGGDAHVKIAMRGLALLYASAAGPAVLRRAGLLSGGDGNTDALLQAVSAGPAPAILDLF